MIETVPLRFLLVALASWVNRQLMIGDVIDLDDATLDRCSTFNRRAVSKMFSTRRF